MLTRIAGTFVTGLTVPYTENVFVSCHIDSVTICDHLNKVTITCVSNVQSFENYSSKTHLYLTINVR